MGISTATHHIEEMYRAFFRLFFAVAINTDRNAQNIK